MEAWQTVPATSGPVPSGVPGWEVLVASARGSLHTRSGVPLQDAAGWWPGPRPGRPGAAPAPGVVVAVSDGVGSRDCFRSDRGARMAVAAACAVGTGFLTAPTEDGGAGLMAGIVARWTASVRADLTAYPVRGEELTDTSVAWDDADPALAYAATLLVAVATPDRLLLAQLGDGDLLVVDAAGDVTCPLPPDPSSVAGTTATLMQPDAAAVSRTRLLDLANEPVDLVLLATDGYGNAFADPDWTGRVGRDVRDQLRADGTTSVRGRIGDWVTDAATVGGDDASLALLVRARA
jgi:hypothetical protein